MEKSKTPEIRFMGFNGEWVEKKLGEIYNVYSGQTPPRNDPRNFDNPTIPWIKTTDLNNASIYDCEEMISQSASRKLKLLSVGTVLIAMYGGFNQIGRTGILGLPATINQALSALEPIEEIIPYFLLTELNLKSYEWKRIAASSRKDPNITKKDVEEFVCSFPCRNEQTQIGVFFKQLDDTIALHQQELDSMKQAKQGFLQKMFPQEGETVPALRFPGFNGEWGKKVLGDIVERVTRKNSDLESTLPLTISAQLGLVDQNTFFDKQVASKDVSNYYLIKNGEFAYNKSYSQGYPWGAVKRLDKYEQGVLSVLYILFRPTNVCSDFLVTYYDTDRWHQEVSKRAAEGARNHGLLNISAQDFFETTLSIPADEPEQTLIGSFFKQLDEAIALKEQELEALKQTKKAFLQKMFV